MVRKSKKIEKAGNAKRWQAVYVLASEHERLEVFRADRRDSANLLREAALALLELWESDGPMDPPFSLVSARKLRDLNRELAELRLKTNPTPPADSTQ